MSYVPLPQTSLKQIRKCQRINEKMKKKRGNTNFRKTQSTLQLDTSWKWNGEKREWWRKKSGEKTKTKQKDVDEWSYFQKLSLILKQVKVCVCRGNASVGTDPRERKKEQMLSLSLSLGSMCHKCMFFLFCANLQQWGVPNPPPWSVGLCSCPQKTGRQDRHTDRQTEITSIQCKYVNLTLNTFTSFSLYVCFFFLFYHIFNLLFISLPVWSA